jgi:F-type H+-transporting ATPase subunit delta
VKGGEAAARRYARALLDIALAKGDTGLREDLDLLAGLYSEHVELRSILLHPTVPADKKTAVVGALWKEKRPSELLERLVALLVERDRVELLPLIAAAYARLWNLHGGVVEAEAVSARELDEMETRAVATAVGKAVGKQVDLRRRVDPSLMGGLLLRMEGRVYDGSVRAKLRALRERLAGVES